MVTYASYYSMLLTLCLDWTEQEGFAKKVNGEDGYNKEVTFDWCEKRHMKA